MKKRSAIFDWPEPVSCSAYIPCLNIGELNGDQKKIFWKHLKINFEEKAMEITILMDDPVVRALRETFDASLTIESMYVPDKLKHLIK